MTSILYVYYRLPILMGIIFLSLCAAHNEVPSCNEFSRGEWSGNITNHASCHDACGMGLGITNSPSFFSQSRIGTADFRTLKTSCFCGVRAVCTDLELPAPDCGVAKVNSTATCQESCHAFYPESTGIQFFARETTGHILYECSCNPEGHVVCIDPHLDSSDSSSTANFARALSLLVGLVLVL